MHQKQLDEKSASNFANTVKGVRHIGGGSLVGLRSYKEMF